jgi:hypothetical protein
MEKLFNYLKKIENFYFENLLYDDFYKINQYYIYKKLATKNQLENILNENSDLTLFNQKEFDVFKKHRLNLLTKTLNLIDFDKNEKQYIYMLKPNTENVHPTYVMSAKQGEQKMIFKYEALFPKIEKGIVFLKEKRTLNIKQKNFNNLDDLSKNENIGLYIQKLDSNKIKIICYDYNSFKNFFIEDNDYIFPILFAGQISNNKDTKDLKFQEIPYNGAVINWTIARKDVSGRNILYPMLACYANNNILISDRHSLSKFSKGVWVNFFSNHQIFDKRFPIDDWENKITIKDTSDDGILFKDKDFKVEPYDFKKIKDMSPKEQKEELSKIRSNDPFNWAYELNSSIKSKANEIKDILINNHEEITKKYENINKKLNDLANDFYDKNIS